MKEEVLLKTVERLMKPPKGILAIDESMKTCQKRFEKLGIPFTEEKRQEYRQLLITAPGIEQYISGYILFDETIKQKTKDGEDFTSIFKRKGIDVGIKVDEGPIDYAGHAGEKITSGLVGLNDRLKEYRKLGATFAKWRAVYTITEHTPSAECMQANAELFTQYAKLCQQNDIVPIVEPEVLMDGNHSMEKCYEVTARNLQIVFAELEKEKIYLPGMILKTNMILPGKDFEKQVFNTEIAQNTVKCLKEKVPKMIGGIVFLSGGQKDEDATANLNLMHKLGPLPWPLTFSYGRAIQNGALEAWAEEPDEIGHAQDLLLEAAKDNSLASIGQYNDHLSRKTSRHPQ